MFNKELALINRLDELEKAKAKKNIIVREYITSSAKVSNILAISNRSLNKGSPILSSIKYFL